MKNSCLNGGQREDKNEGGFNPFEAFMYIPKPKCPRREPCKNHAPPRIPYKNIKDSTKYNTNSQTQTLVIALPCVQKWNNTSKMKNAGRRGNACPTPVQNVSPSITLITSEEEENQIDEKARIVSPYFQKLKPESVCPMITGENQIDEEARIVSHHFKNQNTKEETVCEKRKGKKRQKVRIVSPYFPQTSTGRDGDKKKNRTKVKTSPYFSNKASSENNTIKSKPRDYFSPAEKMSEAYKRKTSDNLWRPPRSHHNLIQEDYWDDPWKVLVICVLLNVTTGTQTKKVLGDLFTLCPDAKTTTEVETDDIVNIIRPLGIQHFRAATIKRLSHEYLSESWTHVTQLHGIGKYGGDAYAIFCTGKWRLITPKDHKLNLYWDFLHEKYA